MSVDLALGSRSVEGPEARLIEEVIEGAAALYRPAGRFAYFFARGKLRGDTLFATLLRVGAIPDGAHVLDLGCGQGLVAAWFTAAHRGRRDDSAGRLHWSGASYCGVDQSTHDVARARAALPEARIIEADLRRVDVATLGPCDVVTLLDVLHYLEPDAQVRVLRGAHAALRETGALILRVGDAASAGASHRANVIDLMVCALRGHPRAMLHRRSISAWATLLLDSGFDIEILEDDRGNASGLRKRTAFANVLLRARKRSPGSRQ